MTKKRIIIITSILLIIVIGALSSCFLLKKGNNYKEQNEEKQKDTILLKENLEFEINSELTLLSLVSEDNKVKVLSDNEKLDTSTLGGKEITIKYEVEEDEEEKTVTISIIDTQAPTIEFEKELSTIVGTKMDLLKDVKVTDNSKEEIKASVVGDYDFDKEGIYNLKYIAIDSSNNKKEEDFTLKVNKKQTSTTNTKPSNNNNKGNSSTKPNTNNNSTNQSNNDTNLSSNNMSDSSKPWEALGITEDQYYNEPILKDARVDFPVEICGSEKACNTACLESGDKIKNGAYNCMPIKTASGRYLGEMLNVKKLQ